MAAALAGWGWGKLPGSTCVSGYVAMSSERQAQSAVTLTARVQQLHAVVPFTVIGTNGRKNWGWGGSGIPGGICEA